MTKMSEGMRVKLSKDPNRDRMYGPALMGLPTRQGHLVGLIPTVGMLLTAGDRKIVITTVEYNGARNSVRCTCESEGQVAVRPWGQLYDAIEAGKIAIER